MTFDRTPAAGRSCSAFTLVLCCSATSTWKITHTPPSSFTVAYLIIAIYPCFPRFASDNRYHLQALRHLSVLATVRRSVQAVAVDTRTAVAAPLSMDWVANSAQPPPLQKETARSALLHSTCTAPCLLPVPHQVSCLPAGAAPCRCVPLVSRPNLLFFLQGASVSVLGGQWWQRSLSGQELSHLYSTKTLLVQRKFTATDDATGKLCSLHQHSRNARFVIILMVGFLLVCAGPLFLRQANAALNVHLTINPFVAGFLKVRPPCHLCGVPYKW